MFPKLQVLKVFLVLELVLVIFIFRKPVLELALPSVFVSCRIFQGPGIIWILHSQTQLFLAVPYLIKLLHRKVPLLRFFLFLHDQQLWFFRKLPFILRFQSSRMRSLSQQLTWTMNPHAGIRFIFNVFSVTSRSN